MIRSISNALKRGDHVTLSGFGTFTSAKREMDATRRRVLRSRSNLNVSQSSALA
jgi:nucleoid DNA-binding protein